MEEVNNYWVRRTGWKKSIGFESPEFPLPTHPIDSRGTFGVSGIGRTLQKFLGNNFLSYLWVDGCSVNSFWVVCILRTDWFACGSSDQMFVVQLVVSYELTKNIRSGLRYTGMDFKT